MKITGYVIAVIGLAVFAIGFLNEARGFVTNTLKINISSIDDISLVIAGAIIIAIGIFFIIKSSHGSKFRFGHKRREVPIYQGKEIVGYRRRF